MAARSSQLFTNSQFTSIIRRNNIVTIALPALRPIEPLKSFLSLQSALDPSRETDNPVESAYSAGEPHFLFSWCLWRLVLDALDLYQ